MYNENVVFFNSINIGVYEMTTLNFNLLDFLLINEKSKKQEIVKKVTVSEFLKFVKANPNQKFELVNGKIIPMANVKPNHGKITANFSRILGNHLFSNNSPCFAFQDIACKIDEYNAPHPDIVVVCNETVDDIDFLAYPTVVGEVYSSNRNDDKDKLVRYKNCSSIQEILMIEQKKIEVIVYKRNGDNWVSSTYRENDTIFLNSIDFSFSTSELYRRVVFKKK